MIQSGLGAGGWGWEMTVYAYHLKKKVEIF